MDSPTSRAPRGLSRDIHQIRQGSSATAAELREFISKCRGRKPEEVMGLITQSTLVQCTTLATIATVVFMAIFTVGPYLMNQWWPSTGSTAAVATAPAAAKSAGATNPAAPVGTAQNNAGNSATQKIEAAKTEPAKSDTAKTAPSKSNATPAKNDLAPPVADPTISSADKQRAVEKLGVGETKSADPRKNPLENSSDDLLKDLK